MNPLINEIREQVAGAWRFRWVALATAAVLALAGWLVVFGLQDRYEARASVFVDTRLGGKEDVDTEMDFVRQSLVADPSLRRLARESGLLPAGRTDAQQQALLAQLRQRIDISAHSASGHEERGVYDVTYQDHDRVRSLKVVAILLDTLGNSTLSAERERSKEAQQVSAELEKRLQAAEEKLAEFKRGHPELADGDYAARRKAAMDELDRLRSALALAEEKQRQAMPPANGVAPAGQAGDLAAEIRKAEDDLKQLRQRFTDKHPDVIAARERLEELKKSQLEKPPVLAATAPASAAEIAVAAARKRVEDQQKKIAELEKGSAAALRVDSEYARLQREYDATAEQLRRARGEGVAGMGSLHFRTVQPPTAAYDPVWPRRGPWLAAILAAALAVGAALAGGLNYLFPVFTSGDALRRTLALPVLGTISSAFSERQRRASRRELLRISMATACLLVAFGVAIVLSQSGYRLSIAALSDGLR